VQILVFSDSHGSKSNMNTAIQTHPDINYIIHLGDWGTDIDDIANETSSYIIEVVQGNCDIRDTYPNAKVLQLEGKRIFLTHGHIYGVKNSLISLIAKGLKEQADVVLFGHTHLPLIDLKNNMLLVNPGSISLMRGQNASYAILDISIDGINAKIYRMN